MADHATVPAATAARLVMDGETTVTLPLVEGSERERSLDIAQLRNQTGLITFDPGFGNTGACRSWIEMRNDPDTRIARPRQIYTGETEREYKRPTVT